LGEALQEPNRKMPVMCPEWSVAERERSVIRALARRSAPLEVVDCLEF